MEWVFHAYRNSCASFRAIKILGTFHQRSFSVGFLWKKVQQLGIQFFIHVGHIRVYFSGITGIDEVYPTTTKGKIGVLAAIDQVTHLIIGLLLKPSFTNTDVTKFFTRLKKRNLKIRATITDLSKIYPLGILNVKHKIKHIGCVIHIKRHLNKLLEKTLAQLSREKDQTMKLKYERQVYVVYLSILELFTLGSPVELLKRLETIQQLEGKFVPNPFLKPFFRYLRDHKDILIQTYYNCGVEINNTFIERFFGHIRHKLKIVRGWKTTNSLENYIGALAIFRNFSNFTKSGLQAIQ
jgi:transposase-like protein